MLCVRHWRVCEVVEEQQMGEMVTATDASEQKASRGVIKEERCKHRERTRTPQEKADHVVLQRGESTHDHAGE